MTLEEAMVEVWRQALVEGNDHSMGNAMLFSAGSELE
jgi:hypothetical protein